MNLRVYIIAIAFFTSCFAIAQKNFIDQNYIEISGQAETLVTPDEIYVSLTLTEKDHKKTVEEQEKQLVSNLKSLGIDTTKDFSVADFNGRYVRKFLKRNEVKKTKAYQLLVHDGLTLSKVYAVFDALAIHDVKIAKVSHSEIEKFRRDTKINALKAAKDKAKEYAKAIDQEIGKALFIQEQDQYYAQPISQYSNIAVQRYKEDKFEDLSFQKIKITTSVLTRFELK